MSCQKQFFKFLMLCAVAVSLGNAIRAAEMATKQFRGLRATDAWGIVGLPNPERGFRYETRIGEDLTSTGRLFTPSAAVSEFTPPTPAFSDDQWILGMERCRPFGVTVMQAYCYLTEYKNKPISKKKLALLARSLRRIRERGYKVILRFAYEKDMTCNDGAPPKWMRRHIKQLRPVINQYSDVVFAMYAGFFGAWGEWHSDKYTDNHDYLTRGEIVRALIDILPSDCPVLMRTPQALLGVLDSPYFNKRRGYYLTRFGFNNDAFMAEDAVKGEFTPKAEGEKRKLYDFVVRSSRNMLIDGELFWNNLVQLSTKQVRSDFPNDGLEAAARLAKQHYTCLSLPHSYSDYEGRAGAIDKWMLLRISAEDLKKRGLPFSPSYFKDAFGGETRRTAFDYIRDHLGYNLQLLSATYTASPKLGGKMRFEAFLRNYGFSAPIRKRNVYVVIIDPNGKVFPFKTDADPRSWRPSRVGRNSSGSDAHAVSADFALPKKMTPGWCEIGLWLPDIHTTIKKDARYAIRLANRDTNWWTTAKGGYGINLVGRVLIKESK